MQAPTLHRFSVADYYRMAESGVLAPNARVELLDGEIIDMSPIGPFHSGVVSRLDRHFNRLAKNRWLVWPQNPVHLDDFSEQEPDLALVTPTPDDYTSRHPRPEDVLLLIEVADASLGHDRTRKLPIYGRMGIPEYWIVNLPEECVEVYREPHFTGFGSAVILRAGDKASPRNFPDAAIDVAQLLSR